MRTCGFVSLHDAGTARGGEGENICMCGLPQAFVCQQRDVTIEVCVLPGCWCATVWWVSRTHSHTKTPTNPHTHGHTHACTHTHTHTHTHAASGGGQRSVAMDGPVTIFVSPYLCVCVVIYICVWVCLVSLVYVRMPLCMTLDLCLFMCVGACLCCVRF